MGQSILVVGAGAIGAIAGVHLIEQGHTVDLVDANAAHVAAVRANGLRLSGVRDVSVPANIILPEDVSGTYDIILLAVKAPHTASTLDMVKRVLAADGCVVSLQNGLEEYRIADAVGADRTIGGYLTFGGFFVEPGHIKNGGSGSFKIGEVDGQITDRIKELGELLAPVHKVDITDNIFGYLWAKMALGAVYFGTAIADMDVVDVYQRPKARAVLAKICAEVTAVADAKGIRIENSDGFDPKAFRAGGTEAEMQASWDAQTRYWNSHDNRRTGVWRDLATFKRPTEVDFQVLPVIEIGEQLGVPTPWLRALRNAVKAVEAGDAELGIALLEALEG
ncbi:2-dehydropantoate 2-reductase [Devosia sp. MC1541]|uniref:ketopantoate reductase family protein n=1 Tax=Devosia sp. MC1541 TaxID=2725264 RepID=UPI00145DF8AB|nr:2-dehydropantoate 2-reductase [Devosia sp. MC1541]